MTRRSLFAALAGALWPWKAREPTWAVANHDGCTFFASGHRAADPTLLLARQCEQFITARGQQWFTLTGNLPTEAGSAMELYTTTKSDLGPA